jgi:hypothetical protein
MPNEQWHPAATFNDGFRVQFEGQTEQEVITKLKTALKAMEEACQTEKTG